MDKKPKTPLNEEFAGIDAALKRAAKAAHLLARKTKTPCYIWKDGQIVDIAARKKSPSRSGQTSGK
jgi:predicted GNAT family acetyltransferase